MPTALGQEFERAVIHEAGHAVAKIRCGGEVATIGVSRDGHGITSGPDTPTWLESLENGYEGEAVKRLFRSDWEPLTRIVCILAGSIAEDITFQDHDPEACTNDECEAMCRATDLANGDEQEAKVLVAWLRLRTRRFLSDTTTWNCVTLLAEEIRLAAAPGDAQLHGANLRAIVTNIRQRIFYAPEGGAGG